MTSDESDSKRVTVERERFKLCPRCGNFVGFVEKDVYCIICGEKYIGECPACREPILYPIARYCPACGERLVAPEKGDVTRGASQRE